MQHNSMRAGRQLRRGNGRAVNVGDDCWRAVVDNEVDAISARYGGEANGRGGAGESERNAFAGPTELFGCGIDAPEITDGGGGGCGG